MNAIKRLFRFASLGADEQERAIKISAKYPRDPALLDWFTSEDDDTGLDVNSHTAMTLSAVFSAVDLLSKSMAMLPAFIYERLPDGGKRQASEDPLHVILHSQPNAHQSPYEFKYLMQWNLLLRGNAYALIERDRGGKILSLVPLNPDRVEPYWADGKRFYKYWDENGKGIVYLDYEIFHLIVYPVADGLKGQSVISYARRSVGSGIGSEKFGARLFKNGAVAKTVLTHPGKLDDKSRQNLKESWDKENTGVNKAHKTWIFEEGMKAQVISIPPNDAQWLESRKFTVEEVARWFGVPQHMIGGLEHATFSNIEEQSIQYVTYSLQPWTTLWEERISIDMILPSRRSRVFVEFDLNALLRGDLGKRYAAYAVARQWGWMNANEIRQKENMNPMGSQGDVFLVPMNMVNAAAPPDVAATRTALITGEIVELAKQLVGSNGNGVAHVEK